MNGSLRRGMLRTTREQTRSYVRIARCGFVIALLVGCERLADVQPSPRTPPATLTASAAAPRAEPIPSPDATVTPETRADLARVAAPYAEARALARAGRDEQALTAFLAVRQRVPELAELATLHAASLAGRRGDTATQRELLIQLRADTPQSLRATATEVELAEAELASGLIDAAQARLRHILAANAPDALPSTDDNLRARAALTWARCRWESGDAAAALAALAPLRARPDATGSAARGIAADIETRDARAGAGAGAGSGSAAKPAQLTIRRAQDLALDGRLDDAATLLIPVGQSESSERWAARLELADVRRRQGAFDEARSLWASVAVDAPNASLAGTALFESGKLEWRQDHDSVAQRALLTLVERNPDHPRAAEAWQILGWIAEGSGQAELAARRFAACAQASSVHDAQLPANKGENLHDDCIWRAGFAALTAGHAATAEAHLAQLPHRDDALYWRAVALDRLTRGHEADATRATLLRRSPNGYYAWWISTDRAARANAATPATASPTATPSLAAPSRAQLDQARRRARLLAAIDEPAEAAAELELGERALGPSPELLEELALLGDWPRTVKMARRLADAGRQARQDLLYPDPFRAEMERAAETTGADPILLTSIARQESLFDPHAKSSAGAIGLLQLMPTTAADLAGRPVPVSELVDPARSAELGARELSRLLDRYDRRLVLAIAAYNAGPAAVARWVARFPDAPGDEFVERISFRETRNYVKAVLRNYRQYRSLHGEADAPALPLY